MWTALPRKADASSLELDVLVSPRLGLNAAAGTEFELSDFPEFEHWTKTLADDLTFKVELADGRQVGADVVATLDDVAWDHIFRATTFVRPWKFRDLSDVEVHSYSVRFITAYLRDLYTDIGRRFPALPPLRDELDGFRETVGPVTDVRVESEREPPPREDREIPLPEVEVPPEPPEAASRGCLAALWTLLERLCKLAAPLCRRLPPRIRWMLGALFGLLRQVLAPEPHGPPPDPTKPKVSMPRTVHPSPYVAKAPLGPPSLPVLDALAQEMAANKAIAPAASAGAIDTALQARELTFDFARAKRFYERPESETPPPAPPAKPRMDFHQALGAISDYPELMRKLALVVRLRIARPAGGAASIRVIPSWNGAARASDVCPRTRCALDGNSFTAVHKPGSDFTDGVLDLGEAGDRLETDAPKFDVVQVDADGAALKAMLTAASLERAHQLAGLGVNAIDRPTRETVPALRSGGLALVRADRGWYLHEHLVEAAARNADPLAEDLFAEDLVRGYRIDVKPEGGSWHSLCERVGTYDLVDDAGTVVRQIPIAADHGYVKRTSATSAAGNKMPVYVHEALARWTGWSLVAQRPGRTLEERPGETPHDQPREPRNDPETEFRLVTSFKPVPGTLPRLRFGSEYLMRAVCVDLAGQPLRGLEPSAPVTDAVKYRRFEPTAPPAVLALRKYLPGESLERVVMRSDFDRGSVEYDQQEMGAAPPDAAAQRTRHLFPPKTSQQMAELHGMFEEAFGAAGDPAVGYRISLRESGKFSDSKIIDVHTVNPAAPQRTIPFGKPVPQGADWINQTDATLPTPYLPDPIAAGAALRGVPGLVDAVDGDPLTVHQVRAGDDPGGTESLLQVPFTGEWPDLQSFRLRVAEQTIADQPPHWDASGRLLTVFLAKAQHAEVRYSSHLMPAALADHGIWDWLDDEDPAAELRGIAECGAHWMITPPRTLVLVHAVQHPLDTARFTALAAERTEIGQTTAEFGAGVLELDVPSTGRVDVVGRWTEYIDDPVSGVRKELREAVACDFAVGEGWTSGMAFPPSPARHEFADTRHRRVSYLVRATSSFREYLRENITTPEITRETPPGSEFPVPVLNSARPIAPDVQYAVPTFDWPAVPPAPTWQQHIQTRRGGGLRVFLDRPWYQSGEGELLGAILQTGDQLPDRLRSRYGLDAIWRGAPDPDAVPFEPQHFVNGVSPREVRLAEPGAFDACVVGFPVEWDAERKRFYCDIEVDLDALPWSYWPFVRFAFVRYQPESLAAAMVSRVVLGEFGQLAPDRTLSLTWQDDEHVLATLRGRAPEQPRPPRVAFRVQTTPVAADPDELDWEHAAGDGETVDWENFFDLQDPTDPQGDGNVVWERLVTLPAARGTQSMRLEVAEYEWVNVDEELGRGSVRMTYVGRVGLD